MALQVTNLTRQFTLNKDGKKTDLTDPNPSLSVDEVMKFYATKHPELTIAIATGPNVVDNTAKYTFTATASKLG